MNKDAHEILRSSVRDSELEWLKNMLSIDYGRVIEVHDINTVKVQLIVQPLEAPQVFNVRLLHTASALEESTVQPKLNDQVLLLFLRHYHSRMFDNPAYREDPTLYTSDETSSCNMFTGVGILLSTAKGSSPITRHVGEDADGVFINESVSAKLLKSFRKAVSMTFDSPVVEPGVVPDDAPVSLSFGAQSPVEVKSKNGFTLSFDKASVVKVGDTYTLEVAGDITVKSTGGKLKLYGTEIVDNDGTDYGTMFNALNTQLQGFITTLNSTLASKLNGSGSPGTFVLDLSAAKAKKTRL